MLSIVATPIGNLSDITLRALDTLKKADAILCENTKHTKLLLKHYEIETKLLSYHKFNEKKRESQVLKLLDEGKHVALVSDAGTPGINDPGADLVDCCFEKEIAVEVIPGASSLSAALSLAGSNAFPFTFIGFFPRKGGKKWLEREEAIVFFESPKRMSKTLEMLGDREVIVFRELTKKFEERVRGVAQDLAKRTWKGECVVLLMPVSSGVDYAADVAKLIAGGMDEKVAVEAVALLHGVSRRKVHYGH